MRRRLVVLSFLLLTILSSQAQESFDQKFGKMISDSDARASIKLALSKIHTATCENKKPCAPADAKELEQPPISVIDGRASMVFAIKSALAQWCGIDWKRSFLPMIAFGKGQMKMNDRQLVLMTLIHSDFMVRQLKNYQSNGACPPAVRNQLDAQLPKV